jgi:hypothetical protein
VRIVCPTQITRSRGFEVKVEGGDLSLLLPDPEELDPVVGTSKWMIPQATAETYGRGWGRRGRYCGT